MNLKVLACFIGSVIFMQCIGMEADKVDSTSTNALAVMSNSDDDGGIRRILASSHVDHSENRTETDQAPYDPITDEKSFNFLNDEYKWHHYDTLLYHYRNLRSENSAQARSRIETELKEARDSNLAKEREIHDLKKQLKKKPWKVAGITFISTITGLTILGRILGK